MIVDQGNLELYYNGLDAKQDQCINFDVSIELKNSQIQFQNIKTQLLSSIEYENILSIGKNKNSLMLTIKASGQLEDDDNGIGLQIVQALKENQSNINIQGSLIVIITINDNLINTFQDKLKQLQFNYIKEEPLKQVLSSDSEDDGMEMEME